MDDFQPSRPEHCTLLVAIPTSVDSVRSALAGGPYVDYVSGKQDTDSADQLWAESFRAGAEATQALMAHAKAIGVAVIEDAAGADWAGAFGRSGVTVLAHWRGADLSGADIKVDPAWLVDRILDDPSDVVRRLRIGLPDRWADRILAGTGSNVRRSHLAECLNDRLKRLPPLEDERDGLPLFADAVTLHHRNREVLDRCWPDVIAPGCRLELSDGLHAPADLGAAVPSSWSGVVDLANCRSTQLGPAIKQGRPDRLVICNRDGVNPFNRACFLDLQYRLLAKNPMPYAEAQLFLSSCLLDTMARPSPLKAWLRRCADSLKGFG